MYSCGEAHKNAKDTKVTKDTKETRTKETDFWIVKGLVRSVTPITRDLFLAFVSFVSFVVIGCVGLQTLIV
jgi:hypothetical protein